MTRLTSRIATVALTLTVASCGAATGGRAPTIVQPGAPGQASRTISADRAVDLSGVRYTAADVAFMKGMISHHAQAIEMVELLSTRTSSDAMRKLGERIQVSQTDEIKMMQRWLETRGEQAPGPHAHHMMGATLMPGMLTEAEMERLSQAKGAEFDRLFLDGMIKHHEGALTMVKELFATAGAGQEPEVFTFASDVDADQRMEIDRMSLMLKEFQK